MIQQLHFQEYTQGIKNYALTKTFTCKFMEAFFTIAKERDKPNVCQLMSG